MTSGKSPRPLLIVVSAPSGAGKTTLCDRLLVERQDIVYSISCTTRPPRGDEVAGRDYFFLTEEEFEQRIADDSFLEHAVVHGYKYGTLRKIVNDALRQEKSVLMDIDVQGARQIRNHVFGASGGDFLKDSFVDIFIAPPSIDALQGRLEKRGEDVPEIIKERLANAEEEIRSAKEYKYIIINDNLDEAYNKLREILNIR